ncbi:hypothetical protein AVEN_139710-1, partial [Araneus ventricosus]
TLLGLSVKRSVFEFYPSGRSIPYSKRYSSCQLRLLSLNFTHLEQVFQFKTLYGLSVKRSVFEFYPSGRGIPYSKRYSGCQLSVLSSNFNLLEEVFHIRKKSPYLLDAMQPLIRLLYVPLHCRRHIPGRDIRAAPRVAPFGCLSVLIHRFPLHRRQLQNTKHGNCQLA